MLLTSSINRENIMVTFKRKSYVYSVLFAGYNEPKMNFLFSSQKNALDYIDAEYDVYKVVKSKEFAVVKDRNMDTIARVFREAVYGV